MAPPHPKQLTVTELPDSARIELPPEPPRLNLRSSRRAGHVGSWFALLLIGLLTTGIASGTIAAMGAIRRLMPMHSAVDAWLAAFAALGLLPLIVLMALPAGLAL